MIAVAAGLGMPVMRLSPWLRRWPGLAHYRIGEARTFARYPRHLSLPRSDERRLRVVLYGIPYSDWNASLCDLGMWDSTKVVAEVRRIPAIDRLLPPPDPQTIVIPMKTEHALAVPRHYRVAAPPPSILRLLDEKEQFQSFLETSGFAACSPARYWSADTAVFPCVVKRLDLSGSVGIERVSNRIELDRLLRSTTFDNKPYLLQELIPGELEFATSLVCHLGQVRWHWTYQSTMAGPEIIKNEDNSGSRQTVETPPAVLKSLEQILSRLRYSGPCIANYKRTPSGGLKLFEINPRFGGSMFRPGQRHLLSQALFHLLSPMLD